MGYTFAFIIGICKVSLLERTSACRRQIEVARLLQDRAHSTLFICLGQKHEEEIPDGPFGMLGIELPRTSRLQLPFTLLRILRKKKVDAIVCKDTVMRSWAMIISLVLISKLLDLKIVFDIQDLPTGLLQSYGKVPNSGLKARSYELRDKIAYRCSDKLISLNRAMKRSITCRRPPPDKILSAPRGADTKIFAPIKETMRNQIRREIGVGDSDILVGWIGRMKSQKALNSQLVPAFFQSRSRNPLLSLLLVGDGSEREGVSRNLARLGLESACVMMGFKPYGEMPSLFASCDVTAVPLKEDGEQIRCALSTKIMDSLAVGVPVVAADTEAVREEFGREGCLVIVDRGDPRMMAEAFLWIADNLKMRRLMGKRGARVIKARMNVQRQGKRIVNFLEGRWDL